MTKTKFLITLGVPVALVVFVFAAILSGLKGNNEYTSVMAGAGMSQSNVSPDQTNTDNKETGQLVAVEVIDDATIAANGSSSVEVIAPAESETQSVDVGDVNQIDDTVEAAMTTTQDEIPVAGNKQKENEVEGALYSVVDGNKLDANSYSGFKLFRNWCARCHGTYGQGMVGPNLADSLKVISEKEFFDTVENGKTGSIGSMPAWKANQEVMEGRDQLYAYLMARSDGAIGVIKPQKQ